MVTAKTKMKTASKSNQQRKAAAWRNEMAKMAKAGMK